MPKKLSLVPATKYSLNKQQLLTLSFITIQQLAGNRCPLTVGSHGTDLPGTVLPPVLSLTHLVLETYRTLSFTPL